MALEILSSEFRTSPSKYCKIRVCSAHGKQVSPSQKSKEDFSLLCGSRPFALYSKKNLDEANWLDFATAGPQLSKYSPPRSNQVIAGSCCWSSPWQGVKKRRGCINKATASGIQLNNCVVCRKSLHMLNKLENCILSYDYITIYKAQIPCIRIHS